MEVGKYRDILTNHIYYIMEANGIMFGFRDGSTTSYSSFAFKKNETPQWLLTRMEPAEDA